MTAKKIQKSRAAAPNPARKLKSVAAQRQGTLSPQESVASASKRMRKLGTKKMPVTEDRKLIGTVDEQDPDLTLAGQGHDPAGWHVSEIMKHDVIFCYEDEDCDCARRVMVENDLDYLPVVDRELRIVGILDRREVADGASESEK